MFQRLLGKVADDLVRAGHFGPQVGLIMLHFNARRMGLIGQASVLQ